MVPLGVRILAASVAVFYLVYVVLAVRSARLSARQSLVWLFSVFLIIAVVAVPYPFMHFARLLGFEAASNAVLAGWAMVLTAMLLYHSLHASRLAQQTRTLCQQLVLLRCELDEMKRNALHNP
jgi:hypothetical protein